MASGKRIAIFLGAGASKPFGYPLTNDILKSIRDGVSSTIARKDRPQWCIRAVKRNPKFAKELRAFLRLTLPGLGRERTLRGASIIDVLSLVDHLISERRSLTRTCREAELRRARHLLNVGLNGVLRGSRRPRLKNDFVRWILRTARSQKRITVLSTNYDVALELPMYRAFAEQRRDVGRVVDMGVSWRTQHSTPHHRPRDARLAVFKLHGSLNWLRCEVCQQLYINTEQRIASLEFWTNATRWNTCDCEGRLRSLIVAPSLVRDMHDPHLLSIWNAALEDLRRADEWIFIGYSLASEDVAIRTVLLQALHSHERESLRVRVALWDEGEQRRRDRKSGRGEPVSLKPADKRKRIEDEKGERDVRARYRAFFSPSVFNNASGYYPGGVEDIVKALARDAWR